jgi:hypothetical protein
MGLVQRCGQTDQAAAGRSLSLCPAGNPFGWGLAPLAAADLVYNDTRLL